MKSKVIAIAIFLFVFLVPFRMAYISDEIAQSGKFILSFLATVVGFLVAFGIGTNEPFDKKAPVAAEQNEKVQMRKAA